MTSNLIPKDDETGLNTVSTTDSTTNTTDTPIQIKKTRAPRKKKVIEVAIPKIVEVTSDSVSTSTPDSSPEKSRATTSTFNTSSTPTELSQPKAPTTRFDKMKKIYSHFRPTEKFIFGIVFVIFVFSLSTAYSKINDAYSVQLPTTGGTYTEGIVGYARFINPLLGYTDADKDMVGLIYSGLLKPTPDGKLVGDLAKSWTVSEDSLTYTFVLKDNLTFHDGSPLTTDDIEFTIEKAVDPLIKSPRAENWNGVTLEKISPTEIKFILKKPYAPFLENMTLGILPKHIWSNIGYEAFDINTYNREPIGSGPYKIKKAIRNESGIYEQYELTPFRGYSLGAPYIEKLIITFYKNESDAISAYSAQEIDALGGVAPDQATLLKQKNNTLLSSSLPRIFGLFFNQNSAPVLVHKEVREALNASVDRLALIDTILQGWGTLSRSAIPRSLTNAHELSSATSSSNQAEQYIEAGRQILIKKGWKLNENGIFEKQTQSGKNSSTEVLRFSISTSNVPELKQSAEILKETWTKMGADVKVEIFEPSDLTQKVIRPRKYDSLLFGNVVGRDLDLYPFWHSSQRNDPGLNIALYTNIKADKALETIRTTSDETKKIEAYTLFENEIQNDIPAIFLYSPDYIYATNNDIQNINISNMTTPSERFMDVHAWYIETEKVWNIFVKDEKKN